jgi:hypothetical protein
MNDTEKHIYNHFLILIDESKDKNARKGHGRNIVELILKSHPGCVRFREF